MRLVLSLLVLLMGGWVSLPVFAQGFEVTDIVAASDAFLSDPSETNRETLIAALDDYSGDATVQSVSAYVHLLRHDGSRENAEDLIESATRATAHLEPVSDILPKQYLEARFLAAVAQFNHDPDPETMLEMAHVEGRSRAFTDEIGEQPVWAETLKWKADAWGMAMGAYFESTRDRGPSEQEIQTILASYGADVATLNALADRSLDDAGLAFCPGKLIQRPAMKYPAGQLNRGRIGAVIMHFDLDPAGKVINPTVRASVPEGVFDEKSTRVVGKWRFKPDNKNAVGVSCRLERTNVVVPLIFTIR